VQTAQRKHAWGIKGWEMGPNVAESGRRNRPKGEIRLVRNRIATVLAVSIG